MVLELFVVEHARKVVITSLIKKSKLRFYHKYLEILGCIA